MKAPPRDLALVCALACVPLLPFLDAAVSIDAPVFLAVSRQILTAPADPFGFEMIWDPTSPHVAQFNHNPPLLSYYLAVWLAVFGEREWVLHASLLPFALLLGLSFYGIAARLARPALAPTLLLLATPAFLVLASAILLDVPMLAWMLFAVYALLRSSQGGGPRWELAAGVAAAAAGLTKYVGFSTAPLLAAGLVLLPSQRARAPGRAPQWARALRVLGVPLLVWGVWAAYTHGLYGSAHFAGGLSLVGRRSFAPAAFWNQVSSVPVYYGCALLFPIAFLLRALGSRSRGAELAVIGVVSGIAAVLWVLPEGEPLRRAPLGPGNAGIAAAGFAGAVVAWGLALDPRRIARGAVDRFLALWLGGVLFFSVFVNWHVNAADALIAAPPVLLLLFRHPQTRPAPQTTALWVAVSLPVAGLVLWADVEQRDVYRSGARRVVTEIGEADGTRWFVGHWGLQYYLEREGFRPLVPESWGRRGFEPSELAPGDWVVSGRNVSQPEMGRDMDAYGLRVVSRWNDVLRLPLRTTNPDAAAGFYSHRAGYAPFAWSDAPLEQIGVGRVVSVRQRPGR